MKTNKLFITINHYCALSKQAFLQAPSIALENIFYLYKQMYLNYLKSVKERLKKELEYDDYARNYNELSTSYVLTKKDSKGWKYDYLIPDDFEKEIILLLYPFSYEDNGFAFFNQINILLEPLNEYEFDIQEAIDERLQTLYNILTHELIHIYQEFNEDITHGLPKQIKSKYDIHGRNKEELQEHQFRMIEIYPRLASSLIRFKEQIKNIKKEDIPNFIREFIGMYGLEENTDVNFEQVLNIEKSTPYQQKIYQNMVKQFLNEIGKLGYHI